jgi:hypothetical protein
MDNSMDISQYREKPSVSERTRKMPSEDSLSTNGKPHNREDGEQAIQEKKIHHLRRVHGPTRPATCRRRGRARTTGKPIVKTSRGSGIRGKARGRHGIGNPRATGIKVSSNFMDI